MADQRPTTGSTSDEIDLGQLFQMFKRGLQRLFRGILRVFLYLKKNAVKLIILITVGIAIGILLNLLVDKKLKSEVIVMPNFESKDYLYDAVEEIQANVISKDTLFFKNMGIDVNELRGFEVSIEPIESEEETDIEKLKENNNYLEILQNFKDDDFVLDVIKSEILKKTVLTHRITFSHKNPDRGEEYVSKILAYINENPYFKEVRNVAMQNATMRIEKNEELITQIDKLIVSFNQQLTASDSMDGKEGLVLFDKERFLDVPGLLRLKNNLVEEIGLKQMDLIEQKEAITILNLGKTQVVKKQFLNKSLTWLPAILVGLFFAWSLLLFLNRKSKELT